MAASMWCRTLTRRQIPTLFGLGPHGECSFINPVALRLLGGERAEDFLGRPVLELIAPAEGAGQKLHDALRLAQSLHADDLAFRRMDGSLFHAEVHLDPIGDDGAGGAVVNFVDITRRKAAEAAVWHQANHDALTGLANRNLFRAHLDQAVAQARRGGETVALLFVDLDGFKAINDGHGHAVGDRVLRETARRLERAIRESDLAARLAGDEFVVILRHLAGEAYAGAVAAKLIAALAEPCRFGKQALAVTASIGIALYPQDAANAEELLHHADAAMYKAKEAGRRTYRYYAGGRFAASWSPAT